MAGENGENGQAGAEGGSGAGELDDDKFFESTVAEPVEAVPYPRFKSVYEKQKALKEHETWRKEHEPKFADLTKKYGEMDSSFKYMGTRLAQHPYLRDTFQELMDSKDGSFDQKKLLEKLQAEVKRLEGGGSGEPKPTANDPMRKELDELKAKIEMQAINNELTRAFEKLPDIIKAEAHKAAFEGVETDEQFMAEVDEQLQADSARGKADPNDIAGSLLKAAMTVAKRYQGYTSRVLGKQASGAAASRGAASLPAKGPGGKVVKPMPDPKKDPDGHAKRLAEIAREVDQELKAKV